MSTADLAKQAEGIDLARREHQTFSEEKGPIPSLQGQMVRMIIHDHQAKKAGPHKDMRIAMGGKAFSWATRYGFPAAPGESRMWFRQPEHTITYMDFQGENKGYGAGTTRLEWDAQVKVTSKYDRIDIEVPGGQYEGRYVMLHQGGDSWLVVKKRAQEKTAADDGETMSVILKVTKNSKFLKHLQQQVRKVVPGLRDFETKFHVTLAYSAGMTEEDIKKALPKVRKLVAGKTFKLKIGPITDLVNQEKEGVLYLKAGNQALTDLHWKLRKVLQEHGGQFSFPTFKAHVTLAYRDNPVTDAHRKKLRTIDATFETQVSSADIEISKKSGSGWEKIAEPWGTLNKFADDDKWGTVLIDSKHGKLTKKDIAEYYRNPKVRSSLMMDLTRAGNRHRPGPVLIRQTFEPGDTVLRRKNDRGSYIEIRSHYGDSEDPSDLHYYINRRTTEFHPVVPGASTRRVWVDLDPRPGFPWERTKDVTRQVAEAVRQMPGVGETEVRFSGGKGFYVIGHLEKEMDVDQARKATQEAVTPLAEAPGVTLGVAGPGELRLDTTTLKRMGSIRGAYSLNAETGLASIPVPLSKLPEFQLEDATIKKVLGKA